MWNLHKSVDIKNANVQSTEEQRELFVNRQSNYRERAKQNSVKIFEQKIISFQAT